MPQSAKKRAPQTRGSFLCIVKLRNSDTRSPIFEALLERGDVRGIFFGHEHVEDATVIYSRDGKSVMMGLTKMAQAASYSDLSSVMGGRVITLEADGGLSTYVFDSTGYIGATVSSDR